MKQMTPIANGLLDDQLSQEIARGSLNQNQSLKLTNSAIGRAGEQILGGSANVSSFNMQKKYVQDKNKASDLR